MIEQFEQMKGRYDELVVASAQPDIISDAEKLQAIFKEMSELEEKVHAFERYQSLTTQLEDAKELLDDPLFQEEAEKEIAQLQSALEQKEALLKEMLIPQDPNDRRNVIIEVRPGAGGDEAGLFGNLLVRMYTRYAERKGFTVEWINLSETELGGVKEAVFMLKGTGAFSRMKYESGVHRVQRVPTTETQGRIHTSTATVAVLPEMDDVDAYIDPKDVRVDVYRSSGHGGQHVNTTDSAVRLTHIPTGLVVTCQNEKSQLKNKEKAMRILQSRLLAQLESDRDAAYADERKGQLGSGDRSERIRTYNFPQGRVTDHRINLTLYAINNIMDGDLDEIIDALAIAARQQAGNQIA